MKWFLLLLITITVFSVGLFTHSVLWFILSGLLFFSGLFIFDALENGGSDNEFLDAFVKMLEKFM